VGSDDEYVLCDGCVRALSWSCLSLRDGRICFGVAAAECRQKRHVGDFFVLAALLAILLAPIDGCGIRGGIVVCQTLVKWFCRKSYQVSFMPRLLVFHIIVRSCCLHNRYNIYLLITYFGV